MISCEVGLYTPRPSMTRNGSSCLRRQLATRQLSGGADRIGDSLPPGSTQRPAIQPTENHTPPNRSPPGPAKQTNSRTNRPEAILMHSNSGTHRPPSKHHPARTPARPDLPWRGWGFARKTHLRTGVTLRAFENVCNRIKGRATGCGRRPRAPSLDSSGSSRPTNLPTAEAEL